ncbi:MAG: hypothetical protein QOD26_2059 [Betaproteobacteria bacterium]|jgi:hypothetical protein|nr:hypothetical protein [Betaproteobacteria bacterium]
MRRVLALSCALLVSGCSITRIIPSDFEHVSEAAQPGDTAKVTMRSGEYLVLRIESVEKDALIGTTGKRRRRTLVEHRLEYAEIQELKVVGRGMRRFSTSEKAGMGAVAALHITLVLLFFALIL